MDLVPGEVCNNSELLLPQYMLDLLKIALIKNVQFDDILSYSFDITIQCDASESKTYHFQETVKEKDNSSFISEKLKKGLHDFCVAVDESLLPEERIKHNLTAYENGFLSESPKQDAVDTSEPNGIVTAEAKDGCDNEKVSKISEDASCQTVKSEITTPVKFTDIATQTDELGSASKRKLKKSGFNPLKVKYTPILDINAETEERYNTGDNSIRSTVIVPESPITGMSKTQTDELTCPLCPVRFNSQRAAEKHLRQKHDIGNIYVCNICQDVCPSNAALHEHLKTVHNTDQIDSHIKTRFEEVEDGEEDDEFEQDDDKNADSDYIMEEDYDIPRKHLKKRGRKPIKNRPRRKATTSKKSELITKIKLSSITNFQNSSISEFSSEAKDMEEEEIDATPRKTPVKCDMCDKVYQSRRSLRRHVNIVHEYNDYKCNECKKVFTSKETLYHHRRGIHGEKKPYSCEECGASFNFNHSLRLHALKHSGKRPYQCDECDKTYLTANHLKMHVQGVHKNKKNLSCRHCGKMFSYSTSLRVHEMTHGNYRPYQCDVCGSGFINSHALKYHKESKHADNKWFECDLCGKKYKTEFLMKTHRRRHTADGQRYMCDICGRQFMYKSTLEIHAAVHRDDKSFQCSTCGKSFKTYATLYSHQYVHKSDSPFVCSECGKAFKTKERCKAHTKRHSGLKPFACEECGRCFPDKGGLSKHIRTVHCVEKKFVCNVCGKACSRADNLRVHMKIHERRDDSKKGRPASVIYTGPNKKLQAKYNNTNESINVDNIAFASLNRMDSDSETGRYDRIVEAVMDKPGMLNTSGQDGNMSHSPSISPPASNRNFHELNNQFMTPTTTHSLSQANPFPVPLVAHHGDGHAGPMMPHPSGSLHGGPYTAASAYMWNPYVPHGAPTTSQAPDTNNYY